jgi:hypothetical protein
LRALKHPVASAHGKPNQKAVAIHSRGLPQSEQTRARAAKPRQLDTPR